MSESIADVQVILSRLSFLESQIRELQHLLSSQLAPPGVVTDHPYVTRVDTILSGEPILKGTRTPVRAVVEHWKFGDTPEEIARKLPHLRLAPNLRCPELLR